VPDLRALGRAAREAHALFVVDNTVASAFGCDPLRLGAVLSLEALDRVCAGKAPRKLVAVSVARSQLKRHRVGAAAECAHALLEGCGLAKLDMPADEAGVLERGLSSLNARMQAHFDRARALAEYLAANEMVRNVRYPGLSSHPDHSVATGILEHGFGPTVEFDLIELSVGELFDALPGEFRTSPAGGATTRLSAPRGKQGSTIRLFAGTDDPLIVAATLDNALRN
jgi:cystathionine beta-lyase/cystathionine gamma-synthase